MSPRSDQPRRRSFTAKYKLDILTEYDAATPAERGVLLLREALYSCLPGALQVLPCEVSPKGREAEASTARRTRAPQS
jgi:hypothetical protein